MIKLVMTDIDGTLVADGHTDLNPEYFQVIRQLTEKGVQVAVASGRHGVSVKKTFAPVLDCIWIVSQNGCVIEHQDETHVVKPIPGEWVKEFWQDLSADARVDGILDTAQTTYCPKAGTPMYHIVKDNYKFEIDGTGGWDQIPDEIFSMMTIYHPENAWNYVQSSGLYDKWKDRLYIVSTGDIWADCMMPGNNKGSALEFLVRELGIDAQEVAAFGDNDNDVPMIRAAGTGYAVANAREAALKAADQVIPGYKEDGVLSVLKEILAQA